MTIPLALTLLLCAPLGLSSATKGNPIQMVEDLCG